MGKFGKVIIQAAVLVAITYATGGFGTGFAAGSFGAGIFGTGAIGAATASFLGSVALGFAQIALTPKPKSPDFSSLTQRSTTRIRQFQSPTTPWRLLVGEGRVSGPTTFVESTSNNEFFHTIITIAGHEIEAIKYIMIAEDPIYDDELDGDGLVNTGKFSGLIRIRKFLGTASQLADPDLVSEVENWTTEHRLSGRAYIYLRIKFDRDKFPTGIPTISCWAKGYKIFDVRDSGTRWTPNSALTIRNYVTLPVLQGGMGFDATEDIDDTFITAAANTCDEFVDTEEIVQTVLSVDDANDVVVLDGDIIQVQTGDRIQITATTTVPPGLALSTDYYAIITKHKKTENSDLEMGFATTYANALADVLIDITGEGAGDMTVVKNGEPRYTCNGVVETERPTGGILEDMLSSMAGRGSHIGANWKFYAGAPRSATLAFDESDVISDLIIETKRSRRERFNAMKGTYASPLNNFAPADWPPYLSEVFLAEDNGERIFRDFDLSYTSRPHMAQRIAKIQLERHRQQLRISTTMRMAMFKAQPGDVIQLSIDRMGWASKEFEVTELSLIAIPGGDQGETAMAVDVTLQEYAAATFTWTSAADESLVDPAPNTNLPDAFANSPPGNLLITEEIFISRDGGGVKARAIMTWSAPDDVFVRDYVPEHKLASESDWMPLASTEILSANINDIAAGIHDFRVKLRNTFDISSLYITKTQEIFALSASPTTPTGLTIISVGGLANLRWDKSGDLDVTEGGRIHFRHDKALSGASLGTSVSLVEPIDGASTSIQLPLKEGTYLMFFEDTSGNRSSVAFVSTEQATVQSFTALSTISEHTTFPGTHVGTVGTGTVLQLGGADEMDDWADVDAVADWDTGEAGIVPTGTYTFASAFDFTTKSKKRLTTVLDVLIASTVDLMDSREDNIDNWPDFDGALGVDADAVIFVRHTDDDPSGSPTWSDWQRLESGEFDARAFQFKVVLTTPDTSFNIQISELSIRSEDLA